MNKNLVLVKRYLPLLIVFITLPLNAQIISQFTWDADPVTAADIGPDATSVSGSAFSDVGGVGGTNGLNAGLPKADINMVIPSSPTFDIDGIDVSFDYQREESSGTFLRRGSSLIINGCANLSVSYRVDNGVGGFTTVSSGNVYAIPNDDTYRNYRFYYLPATGEGVLSVDGAVVWSNDGPDARNLYWTGSGNLEVGVGIDGTGFNDTFMDNLIIASIFDSPLPIELKSFTATYLDQDHNVRCEWETASEVNNDFFTIERSEDGVKWENRVQIAGAGTSSQTISYSFIDEKPFLGVSFYRLKQTDFDGTYSYSKIKSVKVDNLTSDSFMIYPNPATHTFLLYAEGVDLTQVKIMNILGQELKEVAPSQDGNNLYFDIQGIEKGVYFVSYKGLIKP